VEGAKTAADLVLQDVEGNGGNGHHGEEHTDCFFVSGNNILEGVDSYVVIAVMGSFFIII
jgi:hypothetical protein